MIEALMLILAFMLGVGLVLAVVWGLVILLTAHTDGWIDAPDEDYFDYHRGLANIAYQAGRRSRIREQQLRLQRRRERTR